ncbi:MAG: CPBP family glutamic-type intramembrane protease [Thermoleophilia bacterium]|nr:CPBP family glutamic-type intramembrane protease [Thermoleophilia bacterium]MDH3725525.1 CPBP family glutamic-type intramembrane protease [Thermoleophilia bacterium]
MTAGVVKHAPPYPVPREPVLLGFWRFLRNPAPQVAYDPRPWRTLTALLALFVSIAIITVFAVVLPIESAIEAPESLLEDEDSLGVLIALALYAVLIAPPFEEVIFRLPLAEYQPALPLIGGIMAVVFLAGLAEVPVGLVLSLGGILTVYALLMLVAGGAGLSMRLLPQMGPIWRQHFRWVVYGTSVVFGLIHIANWAWESYGLVEVAVMPLMTLPQLAGGFVLAYARVRLGLTHAILLHGAYNALVVPLVFLV